jgi:nucleoid-associated protein YgaU
MSKDEGPGDSMLDSMRKAVGAEGKPATKLKATHKVKKGESLSEISAKYYGKQSHWKEIYAANKDVIGDNPNLIQPGMELKIPEL